MFLNIETYILRQICIFSCGYPPWICSWKPYHIVCRISFLACLVVNHWPAKTCNANSPDMWKQSELCCFYSLLVQAKIWAEFQHPPIIGRNTSVEHSPRKRRNFRFSDTWSMAGPGPGSSLKVLHSVPLVTNLPFFRFSDTWNLHLASQSRNKRILIWNYFVLTISVNCLRDRM